MRIENQGGASQSELAEAIAKTRMSRFELFKRGGFTALAFSSAPALLGACGSSTSSGATDGSNQTVDFLSWQGYDLPDKGVPTMAAWKKANHVTLNPTYIASHDDIQAKIKGGGGAGIDLITYVTQYSAFYKQLGFLHPLDPKKLPNLKNLMPFFAGNAKGSNFWVEPDGTRTGVPMFWGGLGLNYDSAVVKTAPTSYDVMFEPKYKGKVAVPDAVHDVFGTATVILGLSYNMLTPADLTTLTDWCKKLLGQTKGVSPSYGDLATKLASGDAVFAFPGWAAVNAFAAAAGKKTVKTASPKEGVFGFCDAYAIPTTTDNLDLAHAWINEGLNVHVNAEAANYLDGGTVCTGSVPLLHPEVKALYPYDNITPFLNNATWPLLPPVTSSQYATLSEIENAWQEVKVA